MSSGWVVNVRANKSEDLYYARGSDRQEAEKAVRCHLAAPSHVVEARLPVQSTVFDALAIPDGGVELKT